MRERDNSTPRAKRTMVPPAPIGGSASGDEAGARTGERAMHRSTRPPPLPNRKAHKIKRIKSQRSAPWAALDPNRVRERAISAPGIVVRESATTIIRREAQLIAAERELGLERARKATPRSALPVPAESAASNEPAAPRVVARPGASEVPLPAADADGRWLLLLKVGRDELAGIWDGSLASCEPSVWRPATHSWAPLFEVPQIATIVTATVKQRRAQTLANAAADKRASVVPASPAPRRASVHPPPPRRPSASVSQLPPVPFAPGANGMRAWMQSTPGSGGASAMNAYAYGRGPRPLPSETLRPSSLAEMSVDPHHSEAAARLAMRSPYIPPPPKVPQLAPATGWVHPAFAYDDSESATVPAHALNRGDSGVTSAFPLTTMRPPVDEQAGFFPSADVPPASASRAASSVRATGQDYAVAQGPYGPYDPFAAAEYAASASYQPASDPNEVSASESAARPLRAVDSYAPHAQTIAPLAEPPRSRGVAEKAGWLLLGITAAMLLTTFTGVGSSLREWIDPASAGGLAAAPASERGAASAAAVSSEADGARGPRGQASSRDEHATLSVEELPVLGKKASSEENARSHENTESDKSSRSRSRSTMPTISLGASRASSAALHSSAAAKSPPKPADVGFDAAAARRALSSAVQRAQFCAGERANGTVVVTFSPSGSTTSVNLARIEGEDVRKGCVLNAFRGARITPFQGAAVTVQKSFQLR